MGEKPKTTLGLQRTFNIRLSARMDRAVRKEAERTEQKPTQVIRQAIRHFLEKAKP